MSRTSFTFATPSCTASTFAAGEVLEVRVAVTNTGARAGKAVVQCYVGAPAGPVPRAVRHLAAFTAVRLEPGATRDVVLELDARAFARWSDPDPGLAAELGRLGASVPWVRPPEPPAPRGWYVDPGRYAVCIGRSSADLGHTLFVDVAEGFSLGG